MYLIYVDIHLIRVNMRIIYVDMQQIIVYMIILHIICNINTSHVSNILMHVDLLILHVGGRNVSL